MIDFKNIKLPFVKYIQYSIVFLSGFWIIFFNNSTINNDGAFYLFLAGQLDLVGLTNLNTSLEYIPYAYLINFIHHFLNIGLFSSAKLLAFSCFFLIYILLTLIYKDLLIKNERVVAFLVLFSTAIIMDQSITYVIRDHIFWLLFLLSFYLYFSYFKYERNFYLILAQFVLIAGAFFRLEAIFCIFFIPTLLTILTCSRNELKKIFYFNFFSLLFILVFISIFFYFDFNINNLLVNLKKINLILQNILSPLPIFTEDFYLKLLITENEQWLKFSFLVSLFFKKFFIGFGLINLFLVIYFYKSKGYSEFAKENSLFLKLVYVFLCSALLPVLVNLFSFSVISSRYFVPSYIILMIFSGLSLNVIFSKINYKKTLNLYFILFIIITISCLDAFFDKPSDKKPIEFQVATWLKKNTNFKEVHSNNLKLYFYLDNFKNYQIKNFSTLNDSRLNYIALYLDENDQKIYSDFELKNYDLIKSFTSKKGNFLIYTRN